MTAVLLVALIALAPLALATLRHNECASIPEDVGYWGRLVRLLGPELASADIALAIVAAVVLVAVVALRLRRSRLQGGYSPGM
ncbi:hypothetical protein [Nocardia xishanensis]|uniref:hypothetical protein n=1 Tax=Nocardia xishanensis TaxID=238964 RepID=UPI00082B26D6|nr:hypothetical protein [Nocardia xishanensis]